MRSIPFVERGTPVDAQLGRILGRVTEDEALSLGKRLHAVEVQVQYTPAIADKANSRVELGAV